MTAMTGGHLDMLVMSAAPMLTQCTQAKEQS
jgi:hypothetical protein